MKLAGDLRHSVAALLAEAFREDEAMIQLLGRQRWYKESYRYFELQLDYSDQILLDRADGELTGALLARSPVATTSSGAVWQLLKMMWLLGTEYSHSQRIAEAISERLPAPPYWYINQIAVKPAHQHRGTGSKLLHDLLRRAGGDTIYVDCATELDSFYQEQGFRTVESFPAFNLQLMVSQP